MARPILPTYFLIAAIGFGAQAGAADYESPAGAMAQMMLLMMETMSELMRQGRSSPYGGSDYSWPPPGYAPPLGFQPPYGNPYDGGHNYPPAPPRYPSSILEGTWMGRNGDYLVVHGVKFRLFASPEHAIEGLFRIEGDSLAMMNNETGITRLYEYAEQEGRLILRDRDGQMLLYKRISRQPFADPYSVY